MQDQNNQELKSELTKLLPATQILTNPEDLDYYGKDWTKKYPPAPCAVVLPKTVEQVQNIVCYANEKNLAIVPSGGRTGLSAGAMASKGELVVALDAMNKISDFDETSRTVHCQAGVVTEALQNFAEQQDLFYPVDFASAGSSQIGGNISTNAGGIKVIRYGLTRNWVSGLQVVTGSGELLDLNKGLIKNATGYDLRHLFIGAEGTLGIVVGATIALARKPKPAQVLVMGCPDFAGVMSSLEVFQQALDLRAFEFFSELAMGHVIAKGLAQRPFTSENTFYALLEFDEDDAELAMALFEKCLEQGYVADGVVSQSLAQVQSLWALREYISESISEHTPYKNDLSVAVAKVPAFLQEVDAVVSKAYPEFEILWYGHIGDGNVHLNILKPAAWVAEDFFAECEKVSTWIFEIVQRYQGSVSAEHGVGLIKKPYLHYTRDAQEISYMKAMKQIFDPKGIMNPGKIFD